MIPRTILKYIEESIRLKPVTLITGARQVGKTTLCRFIAEEHGFEYVPWPPLRTGRWPSGTRTCSSASTPHR